MTLYELCRRDVINVATGVNMGKTDDIAFDEATAQISHIIIYGRLRLFGLLGREEDLSIPWTDIRKIGDDVILVHTDVEPKQKVKKGFFSV